MVQICLKGLFVRIKQIFSLNLSVLWGNSNDLYWYVLDFYYSYSSCINICIFDVSRLQALNAINTSGNFVKSFQ